MLACYITDPSVITMNSSEKVVNKSYKVPLRVARYSFHARSEELLNIQTKTSLLNSLVEIAVSLLLDR